MLISKSNWRNHQRLSNETRRLPKNTRTITLDKSLKTLTCNRQNRNENTQN